MTPHPESLRECQFPDSVRDGQNRCSRGGCGPRGALCLLGVLLVARMLVLIGRDVPLSVWAPVAYLWQDLIVVLLFALAERALNRPWAVWTLYAVLAIYVALNVPLVRLFSSPLTWPMIRATRGTLADSIRHHLTLETLALTGVVLAIAPTDRRGCGGGGGGGRFAGTTGDCARRYARTAPERLCRIIRQPPAACRRKGDGARL